MLQLRIDLPLDKISTFCQKWQITEFALFGSVLQDDFIPDSDIDVLITFAPTARWGYAIIDLKEELETLFGRKVDLVTRWAIEYSDNPFSRQAILTTAKVIYAAA